jgi:mannose-1-phosphate guanylyltransferase
MRPELDAVVLAGGEGARLGPLTSDTPKAMVPLLDRPQLAYVLDCLRVGGVGRVILACGYRATEIQEYFGDRFDGLAIEYRIEPAPLGTGGAVRFAAEGLDRTFLVLNGDSIPTASIAALLDVHRARSAVATVLLAEADDPLAYGLVRTDASGRILVFAEKSAGASDGRTLVNAGMYVLEPEAISGLAAGQPASMERDVFPALIEGGRLFGAQLPGGLIDMGTPAGYLEAHADLLSRRSALEIDPKAMISESAQLVPPVVVGPDAEVSDRARIGPWVSVGRAASIGAGAEIVSCAVLPGARVAPGARIERAIVAPDVGVIDAGGQS